MQMSPAQRALIDDYLRGIRSIKYVGESAFADAIRALLAAHDELAANLSANVAYRDEVVADRDRLAERVRELEQDAARYRWLRENWWNYGAGDCPAPAKVGGTKWWQGLDDVSNALSLAELDAAIDGALVPAASPGQTAGEDKP